MVVYCFEFLLGSFSGTVSREFGFHLYHILFSDDELSNISSQLTTSFNFWSNPLVIGAKCHRRVIYGMGKVCVNEL